MISIFNQFIYFCIISGEEAENESDKASSLPGSAGKKTSRRSRKIKPKVRKRSLQNSASSRRSSATIIDVSPDSISQSSQQVDEAVARALQELAHSQGLDENTDVPDAADYQAPFGEEAEKMSESSLLNDMKKQLDQLPGERMQERDEMKRELDELREEIRKDRQEMREERKQELQEMRQERRQELQEVLEERRQELQEVLDNRKELRNEIHEIREEMKTLIIAVEKIADKN